METISTPVEVDTAIAQQYAELDRVRRGIEIQERYRTGHTWMYDEAEYDRLCDEEQEMTEKLFELEAQYTGWERYYHVTNVNGHIHTSMSCSSCFRDTSFGWRTDLSGLTPEEVVEREAYNACSVCMPIAPAEQQAARERYNQAQRDQRKAERDAKATEKQRKAAERAVKLMAKVDKAYADLMADTGTDSPAAALASLPATGDGSLYQWVYGFGKWEGRKERQQTVADVMLADDREQREGQRASYDKDPRKLIAEAKEKGLLDDPQVAGQKVVDQFLSNNPHVIKDRWA